MGIRILLTPPFAGGTSTPTLSLAHSPPLPLHHALQGSSSLGYLLPWVIGLVIALILALSRIGCLMRSRRIAADLAARYRVALEERTRLAQQLHDTLLQGFTGVSLRLVAAAARVSGPPDAIRALNEVIGQAQRTLAESRDAIWDLRGEELDQLELADALETAVRSAIGRAAVTLTFETHGVSHHLPAGASTTALRFAGEATVNALKHAAPTRIAVSLSYGAELLTIVVRDDGAGMSAEAIKSTDRPGHWGIPALRQRARLLAGTLEITSQPGKGTALALTLPFRPPAAR